MAAERHQDLTASSMTIQSDSENYGNNELSSSPPSSSTSPLIVYKPPTVWGLLRGAAINLLLPFVNGLMLGFGELFAHEIAFRLGWSNTKVSPSSARVRYRIFIRSRSCRAEDREDPSDPESKSSRILSRRSEERDIYRI